jgi:site-specific DNA recombinase
MQIRCAIYTRKSNEDGLEQKFNSLDAQRATCEKYIKNQQGWVILEKWYDNGGYSGSNINRPGIKELL